MRNILPVIIPAVLCLIFYLGISCAGRETISREQSSLQQALEQSAIQAYALTGHYPLSLEELLHDYNISYDTDKFVVEYVPSGSNLLPLAAGRQRKPRKAGGLARGQNLSAGVYCMNMKNLSVRRLVRCAVIAAVYVVVCLVLADNASPSAKAKFRLSFFSVLPL